jgi:hypothetical protein
MIYAIAMEASKDAQVIGALGNVREKIADLQSGLPMLPKRSDCRQQRILRYFASRHHGPKTIGDRLTYKS